MTNELAYHSNRARIDELMTAAQRRSLVRRACDTSDASRPKPGAKPSLRFVLRRLRAAVA
jgi:hypothetical protein